MIDNYKDFLKYIKSFENKPKLLLHACCAPCSSHTLLVLKDYFDITIFYSNDNIYPKEEYINRLDEVKRFIPLISKDIKLLYDEYNDKDFYDAIKGLENLGEKSERCYKCYTLRLEKTAEKAKALGFDFFTTTLSISPYKVTRWINEIGYKLEEKYGVKYLFSDFKKDDGYNHSIELSKEYSLYRQDYCGCVYSKQERMYQIDRAKEENKS
ncbi:MAG: epoxyqueuosine reductase QueH [Acholeplasmatales bacterium]|nr:epoxyqueuosine reductase QueH [Acholeplasmatales bacterium]